MHQKILRLTEFSNILPAKNVSLREHIFIVHRMAGVILHMLIDIIADHQIQRCPRRVELAQLVHNTAQRIGIQPVIRINDFIICTGCIPKSLIHTLAVAAVWLMNRTDDCWVLGRIAICNSGCIIGRAVVDQNDLRFLPGSKQGLNAVIHIGG